MLTYGNKDERRDVDCFQASETLSGRRESQLTKSHLAHEFALWVRLSHTVSASAPFLLSIYNRGIVDSTKSDANNISLLNKVVIKITTIMYVKHAT